MSIFRFICLWVLATYLIKTVFSLTSRQKYIEWARGLFASEKMPLMVKLILVNLFFLFALVFYGVYTAYQPYGWILAVPLAFGALEALLIMFAWKKMAPLFVKTIDQSIKILWLLEIVEFLAMLGIIYLGFFVF